MQFNEEALKFLNLGISSEISAYVFYKHAGTILKKDKALQETIHKLANDEKGHFLSLEDIYDRNVRSEMWAPYKDILNKEGLPDIDELVQETHKELLAKIRGISTKREVLEMALLLEKEAYTLFSEASAKTKHPETKKVFDFLTNFERNHVQLIEKELAAL
jgi:rubrerythrin